MYKSILCKLDDTKLPERMPVEEYCKHGPTPAGGHVADSRPSKDIFEHCNAAYCLFYADLRAEARTRGLLWNGDATDLWEAVMESVEFVRDEANGDDHDAPANFKE